MANGISTEVIAARIFEIRGKNVMLDRDLAQLYGVTTFNLNKAVRRNIERFPEDFMFQLTFGEFKNLIFHFGISSWGGTRKPPLVFTEQGIAMLSGALRSKRAIRTNIQIMRSFVKLRRILLTNVSLKRKIEEMESKYDKQFMVVFKILSELGKPAPAEKKGRIGFYKDEAC